MKADSDARDGDPGASNGQDDRTLERPVDPDMGASGPISSTGRGATRATMPDAHGAAAREARGLAAGAAPAGARPRSFDPPTREDADLAAMVGRRIGAYEITGLIARGGMGIVFAGRDTRLQRPVAIKALPRAFTDDLAQRARLRREAKLLASISHPNIATVYGLEQDDADYLVMELVVGSTLAERLARGRLAVVEALSLALQIGRGVEAAHEAALMHRDLKPSNVLLTRDGKVKVVDFGLARAVHPEADEGGALLASNVPPLSARTLTQPFVILGTPGYMSPEQIRGRNVDRRADIFAFGVILYECLTDAPAFPGETVADRLAATLEREPDMAAVPPEVPARAVDVLRRCLAKDPARRILHIGEVCLELEEVLLEVRAPRATFPSAPTPAPVGGAAAFAPAPARPASAPAPAPAGGGPAAPAPAGGGPAAPAPGGGGPAALAPAGGGPAALAPAGGGPAAPAPAGGGPAAPAPAGGGPAAAPPAGRASAPPPAGRASAPPPAGRASAPPPVAGRAAASSSSAAAPAPAGRTSVVPAPPSRASAAAAPAGRASVVPAPPRAAPRSSPRRLALAMAGAAAVGAVSAAGLTAALRAPPPAQPARQLDLLFPGPQAQLAKLRLAISDDGRRVVFGAAGPDGAFGLWSRSLDDGTTAPLPGTEDGWDPTLSPDGQWVAFYRGGELWKRRLVGGNSVKVAATAWSAGSTWGTDGALSFFAEWGKGLVRVPELGGEPQPVTAVRPELGDYAEALPCVLPDNRAVLFTSWDGKKITRIEVVELATGARSTVVNDGSTPRFARTPRGDHLLWERKGTIYAAPFDVAARRVAGPERAIVDGVLTDGADWAAFFDVSDEGTLVWVPGSIFQEESQLAWLGEGGATAPFAADVLPFAEPRFSADGKKLSVVLKQDVYAAFVREEGRGTFDRIVFDIDVQSAAISPDGAWLAFSSLRDGRFGAWVKSLASGDERRLTDALGSYAFGLDWSPDSQHVAVSMAPAGQQQRDIWVFSLSDPAEARSFIADAADDRYPRFSPDGRWLAYTSDDAAGRQVYVSSFPDGKVKRQISTRGGTEPTWAPDGARIYYRADGKLYAVPLSPGDARPVGPPTLVYDKPFGQADVDLRSYTVAPDGRILIIGPPPQRTQVTHLRAMLGWYSRLP
ncbi:protein kinase domain-containing protein [Sorangium sp. So ce131]|uniref:protein kinase domain-containing protein n=1 Tax=Sorangium sp. So ce131 TaxID=3133282 RepID=UPI003F5E4DE2